MRKIVQLFTNNAGDDCALADDGTTWWWRVPHGQTPGEWLRWTDALPQPVEQKTNPHYAMLSALESFVAPFDGFSEDEINRRWRIGVLNGGALTPERIIAARAAIRLVRGDAQ